MSAPVFVKLLAIFAVVAIGWAVARSGRLGDGEHPARVHLGRGVLHLRAGAALSHHRADRLPAARRARPARLLRADGGAGRAGLRGPALSAGRSTSAAPPSRACARSRPRSATAVQIGIPLAAALFGETGLALHVTVVSLHALTLLTIVDRAGRARPRARAAPRRSGQCASARARWRRRRATPSSIRSCCRCWPAWPGTRAGAPLPPLADEILGDARPGRRPALPGPDRRLARPLRRARRAARRDRADAAEARRPSAGRASSFARFALGLTGMPLAIVVLMAALPVGSNALIFAQRYAVARRRRRAPRSSSRRSPSSSPRRSGWPCCTSFG